MSKRSENLSDDRTKALGQVWRSALVMLAVCIPLCYLLRTMVLPLAVIISAAIVTLYVWASGQTHESNKSENEALRAKIKELEDRLANVEVINRFEERLAAKQVGCDPDPPQPSRTTTQSVDQDKNEK